MSAEPAWRGGRPDSKMHKSVSLFTLTAAVIVAAWWWLGSAVPMPPSPLTRGEKLYCISYAPFRGAQTPLDLSTKIEPAQIEEDLAQLAKVTDCVRTYSVDFGLDQVPEIAQRHGLKVLLGLWVSSHGALARLVEAATPWPMKAASAPATKAPTATMNTALLLRRIRPLACGVDITRPP